MTADHWEPETERVSTQCLVLSCTASLHSIIPALLRLTVLYIMIVLYNPYDKSQANNPPLNNHAPGRSILALPAPSGVPVVIGTSSAVSTGTVIE